MKTAANTNYLTREELTLDYIAFKELCHNTPFDLDVREWLSDWGSWDLACSPMNDNERKFIRYGHYLGWWQAKEAAGTAQISAQQPAVRHSNERTA